MNAQNINRVIRSVPSEQGTPVVERRHNAAARADAKDQVTISTQAQDALRLREVITGIPDVRTDKVNALREAIAKGTYDVPAKAVAAKMLGLAEEK